MGMVLYNPELGSEFLTTYTSSGNSEVHKTFSQNPPAIETSENRRMIMSVHVLPIPKAFVQRILM